MITSILGILIGLCILIGGIVMMAKEGKDSESKKVYGITILAGVVITGLMIVKTLMS